MGIFLIIFGWLFIFGSGVYSVLKIKAFNKSGAKEFDKPFLRTMGIGLGAAALGGILSNIGYALQGKWPIDPGHYVMLLIGAPIFYAAVLAFFITFYFRYWRTDMADKCRKNGSLVMILSIPLALFAFLLAGEGMGPYLTYPLVKGFAINNQGWVWLRPDIFTSGGLQIVWYGVLIVGGAVLAYKISDHHFYQKYGRHGIIDTCFLIAFPCGILGARIWYVVGNWNGDVGGIVPFAERFARGEWWSIFAIWEGGLTILGGAVGGILGGVIYMLLKRRYVDIRFAVDAIVPTILLAQAIGRFGNFFNHEVYGNLTMMDQWPLLPTWIKYNMAVSWSGGQPVFAPVSKTIGDVTYTGNMYVPLFLIEALLNFFGYFIIMYLVPKGYGFLARKITKKEDGGALALAMGDKLGFYLIWYGVVRIIMEPLRDPEFNMGTNGMWSLWNSMVYIILGAVVIIGMQAFAYIRRRKGLPVEMGGYIPEKVVAEGPKEAPVIKKKDDHKNDFAKPASVKKPSDLDKPKPIKRNADKEEE